MNSLLKTPPSALTRLNRWMRCQFKRTFVLTPVRQCVLPFCIVLWFLWLTAAQSVGDVRSGMPKYCLLGPLLQNAGPRVNFGSSAFTRENERWKHVDGSQLAAAYRSREPLVFVYPRRLEKGVGPLVPWVVYRQSVFSVHISNDIDQIADIRDVQAARADLLRQYAIDVLHDESLTKLLPAGGPLDQIRICWMCIVNDAVLISSIVLLVCVVRLRRLEKRFNTARQWNMRVPTCPRCRYDRRGLTDRICPECGWPRPPAQTASASE